MMTYLEQGAGLFENGAAADAASGLAPKGVSVVAFSAKWCPPCKVMEPIYEAAAERFPGLRFVKANQEAVPELFERYGVQAIPTYVVFKDGEEVHRQVGALPASRFEAMVGRFAN
jgi:thiol-disulfide isomerase/thioredoxin